MIKKSGLWQNRAGLEGGAKATGRRFATPFYPLDQTLVFPCPGAVLLFEPA